MYDRNQSSEWTSRRVVMAWARVKYWETGVNATIKLYFSKSDDDRNYHCSIFRSGLCIS